MITGPSVSPNFTAIRDSATTIAVKWIPLTLEESRGFITNESISLSSSVYKCTLTEIIKVFDVTLSHKKELLLNQLQPTTDYCVSITTSTSEGNISSSPIFVASFNFTSATCTIPHLPEISTYMYISSTVGPISSNPPSFDDKSISLYAGIGSSLAVIVLVLVIFITAIWFCVKKIKRYFLFVKNYVSMHVY